MITFFALQPDASTRQEIAEWRERCLPPLQRTISAANLHITLAYLGETSAWQLEQLLHQTDIQISSPVELVLDEMGYWPKPKVAWLGCSEVPASLLDLARKLNNLAGSLRLQRDKRPYHPHLTLARKLGTPPPAPAEAPYFPLKLQEFVLMESCRSATAVNYRVVETF